MRRLLAATFFAALLALPLSAAAQNQGSHGGLLGLVPPRGKAATPNAGFPLLYHGGSVMRTNTAYAIFWIPSGYTVSPAYQSTINGFFTNVAAASGLSSNVYASDTQYSDTTGSIAYASTFGGSYVDTGAFPASGCTDPYTPVCLTDAQVEARINTDITAAGWSKSSTKLFFMFTPKNVGSCFDGFSTSCSFTDYCAYHSWGSGNLIYANQPYVETVPAACGTPHPNGDDADGTINVVSHEHNEAITDPTGVGWWDANGEENGDKCAWNFGSSLGSTAFGPYNQVINGGHYYLQQEWSNAGSTCVLTYGSGGGGTPTVGSLAPTSGAIGSSVTITGTNFTGATTVKFNGISGSFTPNSATQITATVPLGATTGPVAVTTPGGTGTSSGNFTVTVAPAAPTISGFSPAKGPVGTTVKITGTGFVGTIAVKFNGVSATFGPVKAGSVKAVVPAGAKTGPISVTTGGGTATSSLSFKVK